MAATPNPISFEAINQYGMRAGYGGDRWEWFLTLIIALDSVFLEHMQQEANRRSKAHGRPRPNRHAR